MLCPYPWDVAEGLDWLLVEKLIFGCLYPFLHLPQLQSKLLKQECGIWILKIPLTTKWTTANLICCSPAPVLVIHLYTAVYTYNLYCNIWICLTITSYTIATQAGGFACFFCFLFCTAFLRVPWWEKLGKCNMTSYDLATAWPAPLLASDDVVPSLAPSILSSLFSSPQYVQVTFPCLQMPLTAFKTPLEQLCHRNPPCLHQLSAHFLQRLLQSCVCLGLGIVSRQQHGFMAQKWEDRRPIIAN